MKSEEVSCALNNVVTFSLIGAMKKFSQVARERKLFRFKQEETQFSIWHDVPYRLVSLLALFLFRMTQRTCFRNNVVVSKTCTVPFSNKVCFCCTLQHLLRFLWRLRRLYKSAKCIKVTPIGVKRIQRPLFSTSSWGYYAQPLSSMLVLWLSRGFFRVWWVSSLVGGFGCGSTSDEWLIDWIGLDGNWEFVGSVFGNFTKVCVGKEIGCLSWTASDDGTQVLITTRETLPWQIIKELVVWWDL